MSRTVGVEEELFLVDPVTRLLTSVSDLVIDDDQDLEHEFFRQQIESQTRPHASLDELVTELQELRHRAADAAARSGAVIVASGTPVIADGDGSVTQDDRYATMIGQHGLVGRRALACATHVHVEVADDEAIGVIDSLGPWLPLLLALSSNSPIDHGTDTAFASWRAQIWDAWPTAGPTERFGDRAQYDRSVVDLIDTGAALDEGMIYFDARVAQKFPTIEVRVSDICTDVRDTAVIAGLARALAETAVQAAGPARPWRVEMLRAARWRARRHGLTDTLVDPVSGQLVPAADAMQTLLDHVADALDADDAGPRVREGVARLLRDGSGAQHQRRTLAQHGLEAVVDDLAERTLSCSSPGA